MKPAKRDRRSDFVDGLSDTPDADRVQQWMIGVGVACIMALYAVFCIATQTALFIQRRPLGVIEKTGASAIAIGCVYFSVAFFVHCHWFLSPRPDCLVYGQIGKGLSLVGVVIAVGYLVFDEMFLK